MTDALLKAATAPLGGPLVRMVATRAGAVECAVVGEGPAVLAVHGGLGGYDQGLALAAAALGPSGQTVVAVSRPGYLGTPLARGPSPEQQADLFADVLDALGIDAAAVLAISAGGISAVQFAVRHPGRCRALVLVSACTGQLTLRLRWPLRILWWLARWPRPVAAVLRRFAGGPERAAGWLIADPEARARLVADPESAALLAALQRGVLDHLDARLAGTRNDLERFARIASCPLERIAAPVLVVHGRADGIVGFSHAEAAAGRIPHVEIHTVDDGEHVCVFSHRAEVRARVCRFLAAAPGDAAARTGHEAP